MRRGRHSRRAAPASKLEQEPASHPIPTGLHLRGHQCTCHAAEATGRGPAPDRGQGTRPLQLRRSAHTSSSEAAADPASGLGIPCTIRAGTHS